MRIYRIAQRSMEPAIREGSYVLVNCWQRSLSLDDVVVVRGIGGVMLVKRIKKIGKDGLFLLGDNRNRSIDSRKFGPLGMKSVIGKVIAVI